MRPDRQVPPLGVGALPDRRLLHPHHGSVLHRSCAGLVPSAPCRRHALLFHHFASHAPRFFFFCPVSHGRRHLLYPGWPCSNSPTRGNGVVNEGGRSAVTTRAAANELSNHCTCGDRFARFGAHTPIRRH
jgi:hypothetical protein